jgi:hypothetical protein
VELTHVYRVFHPAIRPCTFFSVTHGTFSKTDCILGHKASINKYKKIEITPFMLSDHNAIEPELNNKSGSKKYSNIWRLNKTLLDNQWVIEEIMEEIKSSWNLMKMKI